MLLGLLSPSWNPLLNALSSDHPLTAAENWLSEVTNSAWYDKQPLWAELLEDLTHRAAVASDDSLTLYA
jgi:hypothetical protein